MRSLLFPTFLALPVYFTTTISSCVPKPKISKDPQASSSPTLAAWNNPGAKPTHTAWNDSPGTLNDTHTTWKVSCRTQWGTETVDIVSTTTLTDIQPTTVTISVVVTSTETSNATPAPITSTVTETSTDVVTFTAQNVTDTFSTTTTLTQTESTTATESVTTTDTQTETSSTTTTLTSDVATSSGFLPIVDTTASAYPNKKRSILPSRSNRNLNSPMGIPFGLNGTMHPTKVVCSQLTTVSTTFVSSITVTIESTATVAVTSVAADGVTTTLVPLNVIATTTTTITSTSTVGPQYLNATLTFTETSTTTSTSTMTTTFAAQATSTSALIATQTVTSYDACASNNILGIFTDSTGNYYEADNLFNEGAGSGSNFDTGNSDSAYDCCVTCIGEDTCEGTVFSGGTCIYLRLNSQQTCVQGANSGYYSYTQVTSDTVTDFFVSNGNCAYFYEEGQ